MSDLNMEVHATAARHGLSFAAAELLFRALVSSGGSQAQFNHPDLGGMGQWSNGMTQIGDMFNDALKAKVDGFCRAMAATARIALNVALLADARAMAQQGAPTPTAHWWPRDWGWPASSGAQNGMRYACFPDRHRLAIERDGLITLYDTGPNRLNGFSQQQSGTTSLAFAGQDGPVAIESLTVVDR